MYKICTCVCYICTYTYFIYIMCNTHIQVFLELIKKSFAQGVNLYNTVKICFIFMYLHVYVCLCVCTCAWGCSKKPEEEVRSPWTYVPDSCELPDNCGGNRTGVLSKSNTLLVTAETLLESQFTQLKWGVTAKHNITFFLYFQFQRQNICSCTCLSI